MMRRIATRAGALGVGAIVFLALVQAPHADAAFGLRPAPEGFQAIALEAGGAEASQAGAHPFALRTEINFNQAPDGSAEGGLRSIRIDRPAGAVENTRVVEACSAKLFKTPRISPDEESRSGESCPLRSQVGIITLRGNLPGGGARTFGLFDLPPGPGQAALIGANPFGTPITFASNIDSAEGVFSMSLEAADIPQSLGLSGLTITQWGNPWLVQHDLQRGNCLNETNPVAGFGEEATLDPEPRPTPTKYKAGTCSVGNPIGFPPLAYLTLPISCASGQTTLFATSWQSGASASATQASQMTGCDSRFQAIRTEVKPLSDRASSPSGLDVNVDVNQGGLSTNVTEAGRLNTQVLAPSQLRSVTLNLPDEMTVNPSLAAGLGVCTPAQFRAESAAVLPGAGCPPESKIGQFTVESPILDEAVSGGVFIAAPQDNPFGSLLALYLVGRAPQRGVLVKLPGQVVADPASGRLSASFDHLPQLPYAHLNVHLREGQRAPLATPRLCGTYLGTTDSIPWLDAGTHLRSEAVFTLRSGPGGGSCPSPGAPFAPTAAAGSYSRSAGRYTPFYLKLDRSDADQEITSYSAQLPPGLLANLSGVPFCPESAIAAAAGNGGFAETGHPSCPQASKIGRTTAGYGLGSALAYAPGGLYLAGPYHGSPLSVVAVDSATVGPFDLGVIIVRSAIHVDPQTAQVSIDSAGSDPIPHIVKGIPLHLRDIRVYIDRPGFMVNPTSCDHFGVTSTLNGSGAVFSNPADDTTATVTDPFQVAFCSSLGFEPKIDLRLKGGTRRGKFPSLKATVTPRPGQANIGAVSVNLPPSLFLEQSHIKTICSRPQSATGTCPARSIYGHARAITPLMDEPLEGPVYLRASADGLPDLVASLSGRGVRIDVVGRIDSKKGGMRATYDVLPDAPVTKFSLTLNGGNRGLLVNSDDACQAVAATARMYGQNNKVVVLKPAVINSACRDKNKKQASKKIGSQRR
jgi:hypothetical protein